MKRQITGWVWVILIGVTLAACGGSGDETVPASNEPAAVEETLAADLATAVVEVEAAAAESDAGEMGCEPTFRFCTTAAVSGAVEAEASSGVGANIDTCAAWAAAGEARILELPMMLAFGDEGITVALTRVGAYTGPGRYDLRPVVAEGMPDMFPAITAGGRNFNNGEGSMAVVTVNADGSGSIEATDLVEIASVQVSEPDPEARVDFSMQWTCQDR